jgi:hypothetical protein
MRIHSLISTELEKLADTSGGWQTSSGAESMVAYGNDSFHTVKCMAEVQGRFALSMLLQRTASKG